MTVVMLWILISAGDHYNNGQATTLAYFVKEQECRRVKDDVLRLNPRNLKAVCTQAEVFIPKI